MKSRPYILPEGNVQIAFSGGRSSGLMLHSILEANGGLPARAKVVFTNTGREMPETLDFVQECSSRWGVPITWLEYIRTDGKVGYEHVSHNSASRDGAPFKALLDFKGYLPNAVARFCTAELKVRTAKRFCVNELGWKRWGSAIGIRADEPRRLGGKPIKDRYYAWHPLAAAGVAKADVMRFWRAQDFDLRLFGKNGVTPKGNCDLCFLKSEATLATMIREHPDRAAWWVAAEARANATFHKTRSFADLRDFIGKQGDWIFNDTEYLCQVDDGECTG